MASAPMPVAGGDTSGVWKFLTTFLAAIVLTLLGCIYHLDKDAVRQSDIVEIHNQLNEHTEQLHEINNSNMQMHTDMGAVKAVLGITPIAGRGH